MLCLVYYNEWFEKMKEKCLNFSKKSFFGYHINFLLALGA